MKYFCRWCPAQNSKCSSFPVSYKDLGSDAFSASSPRPIYSPPKAGGTTAPLLLLRLAKKLSALLHCHWYSLGHQRTGDDGAQPTSLLMEKSPRLQVQLLLQVSVNKEGSQKQMPWLLVLVTMGVQCQGPQFTLCFAEEAYSLKI